MLVVKKDIIQDYNERSYVLRQYTHLCVEGISLIMGVLGRDVDDVRHDDMSRAPWINSTVDSSWAQTLLNTVLVPLVWFYNKTHNGDTVTFSIFNRQFCYSAQLPHDKLLFLTCQWCNM